MEEEYKGPPLAGQMEVMRWLPGIFLVVLLLVVTADLFTYGFDSHYLSLPIVILHAQPTTATIIGAALFVLAVNVVAALVPRLQAGALLARVFQSGVYIGLLQMASRAAGATVASVIVGYIVLPFVVGLITANVQTNYRIVVFSPPEHVKTSPISEAIIVGPSADGVLLALYDRRQNAVFPEILYNDTLAAYQPRVFHSERLGRIRKIP